MQENCLSCFAFQKDPAGSLLTKKSAPTPNLPLMAISGYSATLDSTKSANTIRHFAAMIVDFSQTL